MSNRELHKRGKARFHLLKKMAYRGSRGQGEKTDPES